MKEQRAVLARLQEMAGWSKGRRPGSGPVRPLHLTLGPLYSVAWRGRAWVASAKVSGLNPVRRCYELLASIREVEVNHSRAG